MLEIRFRSIFAERNEAESPEEFADILEVLDAIADYRLFDKEELEKIKTKKGKERGKFKNRIILDEA